MYQRLMPLLVCCLYLTGWSTQASPATEDQPAAQSLIRLITRLQQHGHAILYSNQLINRSMQASNSEATIPNLKRSLKKYGLRLQQQEKVWVISTQRLLAPPTETHQDTEETQQIIENIIITGSIHRFPESDSMGSSHRLLPEEMSQIPSLGSDVMRAMVRMPGISSVGVSAKPRIRGGLQDELLVLQDGVELLEPFHLADYHSAYSAIDYHTIESVDFYTGGFPSRYGNRISGVMDINNQWSRDDYNTDIGTSSFSSFINHRGKTDSERPVNWLLSYRRGDLEDLTDYIETRSGNPTYKDISARLNKLLGQQLSFSTGIVASEDDITFDDLEESASSKINSYYLWSRLVWQVNPQLKNTMALSYIDFERRKKEFSQEPIDDEEENPDPSKGGRLDHRQQVRRLALRNDYSATRDSQILEFGWQAEYAWSKYRHHSIIDRGELADILGTARAINRLINADPEGWSGGLYLATEMELIPGLLIQPSLRWDMQDYYSNGSEQQWSPRLGFAYQLSESSRLRLSLGRFYQPEGIHELQVLDGETDFFKPQHADQVVLGFESNDNPLQLSAEVYYKRYRDLKVRYENVFNPFVLLPEMEPDRVRLSPDKAFAKGIDIDLKYSFTEHWRGQLRYSLMSARDSLNGRWIPRRWSQDQTVNALLGWNKNNFNASIAVAWHSGWHSSEMPSVAPIASPITLESVLNRGQLRDYFSVDISVRKSWELGDNQVQLYADITNSNNRNNIAGVDYDIEGLVNNNGDLTAYSLTPDQETLLSRVISVGVTWSF